MRQGDSGSHSAAAWFLPTPNFAVTQNLSEKCTMKSLGGRGLLFGSLDSGGTLLWEEIIHWPPQGFSVQGTQGYLMALKGRSKWRGKPAVTDRLKGTWWSSAAGTGSSAHNRGETPAPASLRVRTGHPQLSLPVPPTTAQGWAVALGPAQRKSIWEIREGNGLGN